MAPSNTSTVIGSGTFIRGRVTGTGDLEIAGRVEGEVTVSGEVLVDTSGLVGSNVNARRIVVRGAVRGDLTADEAIILENGARVVGDLKAPRIAIAQGGLVRGHVQTGGAGAPRARTAATARAAAPAPVRVAVANTRPAAVQERTAARGPTPKTNAERAATLAEAVRAARTTSNGSTAPKTAAAKSSGPPPPVVPVLKKGTKAAMHKKR